MYSTRCTALVAIVLSCGCRDSRSDATVAGLAVGSSVGLHLASPGRAHALVGDEFAIDLVDGLDLAAPAATTIDDAFDPFVVRSGGVQWLIEPAVFGGRAGVRLELDTVGDALVGFSTRPRSVDIGGTAIVLQQHAKIVFPVTRRPGDVPQPSASVAHRIGLELELVPMIDPVPLVQGDELPLRVRFAGPALAGCRVRLQHGEDPPVEATSDAVGTVVLPIGGSGTHLVTAEHRVERTGAPPILHTTALTFVTRGNR